MRILLVDDNPIDLLVNEKVVRSVASEVEVIKKLSGSEALEFLHHTGSEVDLILLDIKMPLMNGFDFLEKLLASELETVHKLKVIMVSSSIDPLDREKADDNPLVIDFLEKPLRPERLSAVRGFELA